MRCPGVDPCLEVSAIIETVKPVSQFATIVCPYCSAVVDEGAENCPKCGKPIVRSLNNS
jgi:endogenous inhibitor of DNA gyrase (YacG/DUF329 family)